MTSNDLCHVCGKPAIGMQIFGCCPSTVCEDHAEKILLSMKPGEKSEYGACFFWRYTPLEE